MGVPLSTCGEMMHVHVTHDFAYTAIQVTVLKRVISFLLFQKLHRLLESDFKHRTDLSLEQGLAIAYERLRFVPWQRRILRWYIDVVYAGDYAALVGKLSLSAAVKERSMRLRGGDVVVSGRKIRGMVVDDI